MNTRHRFLLARGMALLAIFACGPSDSTRSIGDARLREAARDTANWLMYGRTYDEQRNSPLAEINETTVGRLGLIWSRELGATRSCCEATPLVVNGIIYTTGEWSIVYALTARTGELLWTYDPKVDRARSRVACCGAVNRGLAFYRGWLYVGTIDGRLIAIDARSGTPVWETVTVDQSKPYTITGAPRVAKGMVLIGNGGAEMGVRGYVSAYNAETGAMVWRTFTVPGDPSLGFESEAMRRAAETWKGRWWEGGGGGTVWDAIVYDPALDLVYIGTGNGSPWYRDLRSPGGGDNLYISSILALRADDGALVWHFQTTPGDNWDFTATQPIMLADLQIGGRARKVLMQAPKNGFFYVLDRETGAFISGAAFSNIAWSTGLDATGRPIESSGAYAGMRPFLTGPDPSGAHSWYPMAFNPATGLVYLPVRDGTLFLHQPDTNWRPAPRQWNAGLGASYEGPLVAKWIASAPPVGRLVAWDPVQQRAKWTIDHPVLESGGVLTTAGNLVFQGRADGAFIAYRATDGAKLWEFDTKTGIMAPPVTYLLDGVQHVTLMVGWGAGIAAINPPSQGPVKRGFSRILTFAIGGNAAINTQPYGHAGPPSPAIDVAASPATVRQGRILYDTYCLSCHGLGVVAGPLPDLRYATAATHAAFESIVLRGAREPLGMPSFGDLLSSANAKAIQAYILQRARESATPPSNR